MSIAKGNSCNFEVWFSCPTFRPDFCPYSYGGTIQSIYYDNCYGPVVNGVQVTPQLSSDDSTEKLTFQASLTHCAQNNEATAMKLAWVMLLLSGNMHKNFQGVSITIAMGR